jgi:hypothetical protein
MKTPWRSWYDFCNRNWWQLDLLQNCLLIAAIGVIIYLIVRLQKYGIPLLALAVLVGCGSETRSDVLIQKRVVTVSRTVQTVLAPDGVTLVKLESVTRTVTDENGQQIGSEETTVKAPEIVGSLARTAGTVATLATGSPAIGQAAEAGVNWLNSLLVGGPLAASTAGAGYLATRRKTMLEDANRRVREVERQRDEVIDGVERAKTRLSTIMDEKMTPAWEHLTTALEAEQSRDTVAVIKARTA